MVNEQLSGRTFHATEAFPEISTAGLISMTFAFATKNDDVAALIAFYMTFSMLVLVTMATYLAQNNMLKVVN